VDYFAEQPSYPSIELPPEHVGYLRHVLATHANSGAATECTICKHPSCPDWRDAYDTLTAAGQLLGDPDQWETPGVAGR
jgi:hypothetical protein